MGQNSLCNVLGDCLSAVGNGEGRTVHFRRTVGKGTSLVPTPLPVFLPDIRDFSGPIRVDGRLLDLSGGVVKNGHPPRSGAGSSLTSEGRDADGLQCAASLHPANRMVSAGNR